MKINKLVFCLVFMALTAAFFASAAHADLYWENENISTGIPNQKNGTTLQKNYFTANASRIETGDGNVIISDYKSMNVYNLNTQAKSYTVMNMNDFGMPKMSGPEKEQMSKMMGSMMAIQVTPTNETKTIAGYKCRKTNMTMAMVQGEYWVSKDVKGYEELRVVGAKLAAALDKNPMLRQMNVAGMIEKLDGFPVQTTNKVMGGTIVSTLKKVEQKSLDPALFVVPKDYALDKNR
ncbi:MAG: DUF4412 domain-containing protein [Syntrophobacteraceae bacterium]